MEVASREALQELEDRTECELDRTYSFFGNANPLLGSVGRVTLYFHMFRLCSAQGIELPMDLKMLEKFNADVTLARHKSQRMSRGSGESLSDVESDLVRFDQEKQSVNDGGALRRQYGYLHKYMAGQYSVELPKLG